MATSTPKSFRNFVIYEIYVRNHGRFGKFSDISTDLPRLREMGVDVVWFMPIHPIDQLNKKGSLGEPLLHPRLPASQPRIRQSEII